MDNSNYTEQLFAYWQKFKTEAFTGLQGDEALNISLHGEQSQFVRWNQSKVRQITDVTQTNVTFKLQSLGKTATWATNLTLDWNLDSEILKNVWKELRSDIQTYPVDEHQTVPAVNFKSQQKTPGKIPSLEQVCKEISEMAQGSDLAGLYTAGPLISAVANSSGVDHWFSNENFFFDFSLYNGSLASKGIYAGLEWSSKNWKKQFEQTKKFLDLMNRPRINVPKGKHRTYLAPGAVSELASMLSWNSLSAGAYKQKKSNFEKLIDQKVSLSPLLQVDQDFRLGLGPRFNSEGELPPETLTLLKDGKVQNMIVSSRSAKEYGLENNYGHVWEMPRSVRFATGTLLDEDIIRKIDKGLYLSNLHYINWSDRESARITGMTRYACFWVENGQIQGPINDLRFDVSYYDIWGKDLKEVTQFVEIDPEVSTYDTRAFGGREVPGMLIEDFTFTL